MSIEHFLSKSVKWVNKEGKEVRSVSIHGYERRYTISHEKHKDVISVPNGEDQAQLTGASNGN